VVPAVGDYTVAATIDHRVTPFPEATHLVCVSEVNQDCKSLLADLRDRGLDLERAVLFVIDGGSGLRKAIRETCGPAAVVQRCQVHKRRNVLEHLPEVMRPRVRRVLDEAYGLADATLAKRRLLQLAAGLDRSHPAPRRPCAKDSTRPSRCSGWASPGRCTARCGAPTGSKIPPASSRPSSATCAAGATAACSSAGSRPACRRSAAASAGCVVTVISLPHPRARPPAHGQQEGGRIGTPPEPLLTLIQ